MSKDYGPKVKIARLYERTSKTSGNQYFAGRIGLASVVMLKSNETGEGGEAIWNLLVSEPANADKRTPRSGQGVDTQAPLPATSPPESGRSFDGEIPF